MMIHSAKAIISGTVSASPSTVQEAATYTFVMNMDSLVASGGFFTIVFPSSYDFSDQTTPTETKTCTSVSGFGNIIFSSDLTCTLNQSSRTLTMIVNAETTARSLSFTVASIKNPTYAVTTSSLVITAYNTTTILVEQSDSSFFITPTTGSITATLTPINGVAGARVRY